MSTPGRGLSLRARLTLWYTAALGALLAVLGAIAFTLLDRGLRANVDASLLSVARTVAESTRKPSPLGPGLDELLASLLGPTLAERFFQLLDPLGRPDPRLAPRARGVPLSETALRNAQAGRETFETLVLGGRETGPIRVLTYPVVEHGHTINVVQVAMTLTGVVLKLSPSRFTAAM